MVTGVLAPHADHTGRLFPLKLGREHQSCMAFLPRSFRAAPSFSIPGSVRNGTGLPQVVLNAYRHQRYSHVQSQIGPREA